MFDTKGDIISEIRTAIRQKTIDTKLTDRDIFATIQSISESFIDQEANKLQINRQENLFQRDSCTHLIEVPITDYCCKYQSKCKIYRKNTFLYCT